MISHFSSRESWPINLPSRLLWLHQPASTTQFQARLPFVKSLLQSQVAFFQFLDPSNASFCLRIYSYAVPLYQKCFSQAYYLGDCFSSFRSWLRCHVFTEAIPDHLGGLKMAVKSVLLPPCPSALEGRAYFYCPWIRDGPHGCFNQPSAAEVMLCQFWARPLRWLAASTSCLLEHLLLQCSCHLKKSQQATWRDCVEGGGERGEGETEKEREGDPCQGLRRE